LHGVGIVQVLLGDFQIDLEMLLRLVEMAPVEVEPAKLAVTERDAGFVLQRFLADDGLLLKLPGGVEVIARRVDHAE
jgi:hypothetical protein